MRFLLIAIFVVSLTSFAKGEEPSSSSQAVPSPSIELGELPPMKVHRFVPTGKNATIDMVTFLNPDCSPRGDIEARITRKPEHGEISLANQETFSSYAKGSDYYHCNLIKTMGLAIIYKSQVGYTGADIFEVSVILPNGMLRRETINIEVL